MIEFLAFITNFVKEAGYFGIFIMTFIESTFIPIPSEVTMIPAGFLIEKGELDLFLVMLSSTIGTLGGSYVNYWIAANYGRNLIIKYGKYMFMNDKKLAKMDKYFEKHGALATFTGRLIPGLRHYIAFPAGLARMKLKLFFTYTALGGGIWIFILLMLGYFIGENEALIKNFLTVIQIVIISIVGIFSIWYGLKIYRAKKINKF